MSKCFHNIHISSVEICFIRMCVLVNMYMYEYVYNTIHIFASHHITKAYLRFQEGILIYTNHICSELGVLLVVS